MRCFSLSDDYDSSMTIGMVADERTISKDGSNKGRRILVCPKQVGRCKYFKFADEVPGYVSSASNSTATHHGRASSKRGKSNRSSWRGQRMRGRGMRRGGASSRGSVDGGHDVNATNSFNVDDDDYGDWPNDDVLL